VDTTAHTPPQTTAAQPIPATPLCTCTLDDSNHGLLLYYYPDEIQETGEVLFENEVKRVPVDIETARQFLREAAETLNGSIPDHNPDCDFCDWNAQTR